MTMLAYISEEKVGVRVLVNFFSCMRMESKTHLCIEILKQFDNGRCCLFFTQSRGVLLFGIMESQYRSL